MAEGDPLDGPTLIKMILKTSEGYNVFSTLKKLSLKVDITVSYVPCSLFRFSPSNGVTCYPY